MKVAERCISEQNRLLNPILPSTKAVNPEINSINVYGLEV